MAYAVQELIEGVAAEVTDTRTLDAIFADEEVALVSLCAIHARMSAAVLPQHGPRLVDARETHRVQHVLACRWNPTVDCS